MTERGYPRDPATGGLRLDDPEVEAGPLTVVSCDNLPRNGEVLARLVRDFCARLPGHAGAPLLAWMKQHAAFPSTMVDRVVPATTAADREEVARRLGLAEYRAELGRRWINPRIAHRLEQIGADGSQKLPARFAAAARERLEAGAPPRWIALALAAWARHLQGDGLAVNDPGAEPIQRALARARPRRGGRRRAHRDGERADRAGAAARPRGGLARAHRCRRHRGRAARDHLTVHNKLVIKQYCYG